MIGCVCRIRLAPIFDKSPASDDTSNDVSDGRHYEGMTMKNTNGKSKTTGEPKTAPTTKKTTAGGGKPPAPPKTTTAPQGGAGKGPRKPKTAPAVAKADKPAGPSAELLAKINAKARQAFETSKARDAMGNRPDTRSRLINAVFAAATKPLRTAEVKMLLAGKTYTHRGERQPVGAVEMHMRWLTERGMLESVDGGWALTKSARKLLGK